MRIARINLFIAIFIKLLAVRWVSTVYIWDMNCNEFANIFCSKIKDFIFIILVSKRFVPLRSQWIPVGSWRILLIALVNKNWTRNLNFFTRFSDFQTIVIQTRYIHAGGVCPVFCSSSQMSLFMLPCTNCWLHVHHMMSLSVRRLSFR